jgi:hypothetical protein
MVLFRFQVFFQTVNNRKTGDEPSKINVLDSQEYQQGNHTCLFL